MPMPLRRTLLILAVPAIVGARLVFAAIADPEGPNLVVVFALAAAIWGVSVAAWFAPIAPSLTDSRRLFAAIVVQIILAAIAWLVLR